MKKRFSKVLTASLTAAMLTGMTAIPVFAANTVYEAGNNWVGSDKTNDSDGTAILTKGTITVTNVKDDAEGLTVKAYQIVKGTYRDGKLIEYTLCDPIKAQISNMEEPQASEITAIANAINANQTTLHGIVMTRGQNADSDKFTAKVEAGLYIVLVESADAVVYNPAVVALNIKNASLLTQYDDDENDTVDMGTYFKFPDKAYLKASESNLNKDIVSTGKVGTEGDFVAYGDTVDFKIDSMTIPFYSDDYATGTLQYKVLDKLDPDGFVGISGLTVKVGTIDPETGSLTETDILTPSSDDDNDETTPDVKNYTLTYKDDKDAATEDATKAVTFEIAFTDSFIRNHPMESVEITYSTTVRDGAKVNFSEHKNTATLSYSNNPSDSTKFKTIDRTTYHYTFGIDAYVDEQSNDGRSTYELNKVTDKDAEFDNGVSVKALSGAEFTLYSDAAMEHPVTTVVGDSDKAGTGIATSDTNGHISFKGLDTGVYYLKETKAPDEYSVNENKYQITINASMNEVGILQWYEIITRSMDTDGNYTNNEGYAKYIPKTIEVDGEVQDAVKVEGDGSLAFRNIVMNDGTEESDGDGKIIPAKVVDTKLAKLPSTGGVGTIIITVLAAIGMGGFLILFLVSRKKNKKEN